MPPCLTLNIIRYGSRVKWVNPWKGVAPSPTPWCSSYRKGSLRVALDFGRQLYNLFLLRIIYTQLHRIKYSDGMWIIFKRVSLTHGWDPSRFYCSGLEYTWDCTWQWRGSLHSANFLGNSNFTTIFLNSDFSTFLYIITFFKFG